MKKCFKSNLMYKNDDSLSIIITENEANSKYKNTLKGLFQPIFLIGDSVFGNIRLSLPKIGMFPFKNGTVKLVMKYLGSNEVLTETIITTRKVEIPTSPQKEFIIPFAFDSPNILFPSYFGHTFKLSYFVEISLKKKILFYDTIKTQEIVFLNPKDLTKDFVNPKVDLNINYTPILFDLRLDKRVYGTTDTIKGKLIFPDKLQYDDIVNIELKIFCKEVLIDAIKGKISEKEIFKYQLVDGCPRAGSKIPFYISLEQLQLWVIQFSKSNLITSKYFIKIYIKLKKDKIAHEVKEYELIMYHKRIS